MSVTITNPPGLGGDTITTPILDTTVLFSNLGFTTCTPYVAFSNATTLLSNLNFNTVLSNVQAGQQKTTPRGIGGASNFPSLANGVTFTMSPALTTYMAGLQSNLLQLAYINNCITEQFNTTSSLPAAQDELALSKDRYEQLQSPETHVSYYEGTFPIYRPIKQTTLFVLFGMGIFFMLLSLLLFLRTQGIQIQLIMPEMGLPGMAGFFSVEWKYIGIASIVGVVLGYFLHVYYK